MKNRQINRHSSQNRHKKDTNKNLTFLLFNFTEQKTFSINFYRQTKHKIQYFQRKNLRKIMLENQILFLHF